MCENYEFQQNITLWIVSNIHRLTYILSPLSMSCFSAFNEFHWWSPKSDTVVYRSHPRSEHVSTLSHQRLDAISKWYQRQWPNCTPCLLEVFWQWWCTFTYILHRSIHIDAHTPIHTHVWLHARSRRTDRQNEWMGEGMRASERGVPREMDQTLLKLHHHATCR